MEKKLIISLSPHIHSGLTIDRCMWNVIIALVPALVASICVFGLSALWVMLLAVGACMLTEWSIDRYLFHRPSTLSNGSAIITGLLLAFNLPSILPWWMVIIGGVVAIGIGKMSFGGLGCNIWNPALVGRVFLLLSFPAAMTTWPMEAGSGIDGYTGATFLEVMKFNPEAAVSSANIPDMLLGRMSGSMGEISAIAILLGLVWLLLTRTITWHIPTAVIAGTALLSWATGGNPLLDILSGGLLLGAVFMATDYVTSPMTGPGQIIFGLMIGFITIIIRRYGAYPEGVSFAILLMNSFVPLINRWCRPVIFGERERRDKRK